MPHSCASFHSILCIAVNDQKLGILYSKNNVFDTASFHKLAAALRTRVAAGESAIHLQRGLLVLPSSHWGLVGGWTVDVLWVYLSLDQGTF